MATATVPRSFPSRSQIVDATSTGYVPTDNGTPAAASPMRAAEVACRHLATKRRHAGNSGGVCIVGSTKTEIFRIRILRHAYEDKAQVVVWCSTPAATITATLTVVSTTDATGFSRTIQETATDTIADAVRYEGTLTIGTKAAGDISAIEDVTITIASTTGDVTVYGRSVEPVGLTDETMTI